jgi:hypothetical protein
MREGAACLNEAYSAGLQSWSKLSLSDMMSALEKRYKL